MLTLVCAALLKSVARDRVGSSNLSISANTETIRLDEDPGC